MKRIAMTLALLAATACLWAQEAGNTTTKENTAAPTGRESRWSLDYEVGYGITRFFNQPALSVLQDGTLSYTAPTCSFTLGARRSDGLSFGLRYRGTEVNTAAVAFDERAAVHEVSLLMRRSAMLTPRLELTGTFFGGLTVLHNTLSADGKEFSYNRFGYHVGLEAGLRYYLDRSTYLFVAAGVSLTENLSRNLDIPNSMLPQGRNRIGEGQLTAGIGIGLKPKVKTLKMDAALVERNQPLQMAFYPED